MNGDLTIEQMFYIIISDYEPMGAVAFSARSVFDASWR